jgi:hypothetical protein
MSDASPDGLNRPELVKSCLVKESRTLDCLRRALMLKALDDAARLIVPVLRTTVVICSDEWVRYAYPGRCRQD